MLMISLYFFIRALRDLVPNDFLPHVKARLIEMCIKGWHDTAIGALRKIEDRLLEECKKLINKHFYRYQIGGLDNSIRWVTSYASGHVAHVPALFQLHNAKAHC